MPRFSIEKTMDKAARAAEKDAATIITFVREAGADEPIVWITGNGYMPPLREIGSANSFYSGSFWNPSYAWESYVETFEETLERADIYLGCPEYDNSLYCVDRRVWQFRDIDEDEAETLSDEWERIPESEA